MAMWTVLREWLGSAPAADASSSATLQTGGMPPAPGERHCASTPAQAASLAPDPAMRFIALLLGLTEARPSAQGPAERDALGRLEQWVRAPGQQTLVPRMPTLLPKLMRLVRRDDVSTRELAEHVARDPALLGEVIRIANSPRYGIKRPISSLDDAITLLGQDGIQQLLTGVAMGPVFNAHGGRFSRTAGPLLWGQAERCAWACARLRRHAEDRFDAYLCGMVANVGLIVALRVLDAHCASGTPPDSLSFHAALLDVNARLSAEIARQWRFPESVVEALRCRALRLPGEEVGGLSLALETADRLGKWHVLAACAASDVQASIPAPDEECYREMEHAFR